MYNNKNEDDCITIIKSKYFVTWTFKENETITLKHNSIIVDLNNNLIDKLPSSTSDYSYYKLMKGEYILIKDGFSFEERIILLKIE